jgi:hypothetical protein
MNHLLQADWKRHKKTCIDHEKELANMPDFEALVHDMMHWADKWRDALEQWASYAMDLGNNPDDYLVNHWCRYLYYPSFLGFADASPNPAFWLN